MTVREAFARLFPHWRRPRAPVSNELPQSEREGRRINESERQRLERISKLPR